MTPCECDPAASLVHSHVDCHGIYGLWTTSTPTPPQENSLVQCSATVRASSTSTCRTGHFQQHGPAHSLQVSVAAQMWTASIRANCVATDKPRPPFLQSHPSAVRATRWCCSARPTIAQSSFHTLSRSWALGWIWPCCRALYVHPPAVITLAMRASSGRGLIPWLWWHGIVLMKQHFSAEMSVKQEQSLSR